MKKVFTKIAGLSVGLALAIGVGVAVGSKEAKVAKADDVVTYTLDGTSTGGNNKYDEESEIIQGEKTWKVTGNTTISPWRIGGKSLSGVDRTIYSVDYFEETITKVELSVGTASGITVNSLKLEVASDDKFSSIVETVNKTFAASSTITFNSSEEWTDCYFKITFNVTVSGTSNKYFQVNSVKLYKESSATLSSISLSQSSVSGYVSESTFDKAAFTATGITVTANYSDSSSSDVTSDVEVTSTVLAVGNNNVTISYGGENAILVVNAKTQEQIDTEAADYVDDLISEINTSESGNAFVAPFIAAYNAYLALNDNAKSKVSQESVLTNFISSNSNYVIFRNTLESDNSTDIFKSGVKGTIPNTWLIPSSIDITDGAAVYNGANSKLKLGKSGEAGSVTFSLTDSSKVFTKVKLGVSQFGSDTGTVSVSGVEDAIVPTSETSLIDISESKLSSVTISTSAKRAYIDYFYFECVTNEDELDGTIHSSGELVKTTYVDGQQFDSSGLSFSVTYNGGENEKAITNISWSPSPLTAGTTSVTGTYIEGEQSATITINGLTVSPYSVINYGEVGQSLSSYAGDFYFFNPDANKVWKPLAPAEVNSSMDATPSNYSIASSISLDEGTVTITKVDGGYTLQNCNGQYLGPNTSGLSSGVVNPAVLESASIHQIESIGNDGVVVMSASYVGGAEPVTVYLRFNATSGQMRARYYTDVAKVKGFVLYKAGASAVLSNYDLLDQFVSEYMHTEISYSDDSDTNACRSEGEGALNYYSEASTAFNKLDASLRGLFVTESRYEKPAERLAAWAKANGEMIGENNLLVVDPSAAYFNSLGFVESNNTMVIVISIAAISALAFTTLLVFKKKRQK
jgi:hypothetical protein